MKLNLGCGSKKLNGYVNVDKYETPATDLVYNLEDKSWPSYWPWKTGSVDEVIFEHSLEHMGETVEAFSHIMKQLHRICKNNAIIKITVPHFRHDNFWHDPTHVRVITPTTMKMLSKKRNNTLQTAETKLGLFWDVDFEVTHEENRNNEEFYIEMKAIK
jgi:predicted SAM-dependent methyltransferase